MQSTRESQIIGVSEGAATRANSADADVRPGSITASIINGADVHADRSAGETGHSQAVLAVLGLLAALPVSAALANNHEADSGTSDAFSASLLGENDPVLGKIDAGFETKKITRKHVTYGVPSIAETSANYFPVNAKTEVSPVRQLALDDGQGNKITVYLTEVSKKETNLYFEPTKFDVVMIEGINAKGEKVLNTYEYFMFVRVTEKGQLVLTYRLASAQANASPTASTFMEVALNISIDLKPGDSNIVISRKIQDALQKSNKIDVTKDRLRILSGGAQLISLNNLNGMILSYVPKSDEEIRVLMSNMGSNARLLNLLQSGDATANVTQQSLTPTVPKAPTSQVPTPTKVEPTRAPTVLPTATVKAETITVNGVTAPDLLKTQPGLVNTVVNQFVDKMKKAGVTLEPEKIKSSLEFRTINNSLIALVRVDPDSKNKGESLEKEFVLFITTKNEKGEVIWKSETITYLLQSQNIDFGFVYDLKSNKYRKNIRAPDSLVVSNSMIVSPGDPFYLPFTFEAKGKEPNWKYINEYLDFLRSNKLKSAAPIIVWNFLESQWIKDLEIATPNKAEAKKVFTEILYKQTFDVVNHCKSDIHEWTINELYNEDGTMKNGVWLRTIGPDYAEIAIKAIRDADSNARIVINDVHQENAPALDSALFNYVSQLKKKGLLRDGDMVGFQAHNGILFGQSKDHIKNVMRKYAELNLILRVTEMDVFDVKNQDKNTLILKTSVLSKFVLASLELNTEFKSKGKAAPVDSIVVLGTTHSSSWLRDLGRLDEYPVLFNDDGSPELTYYLLAADIYSSLLK